ncbi:MAG TPA: hypothetical protein VFU46_09045 [Gemmatimonadales bacterium]|nr:hypothetical protein [Gemmatimonadales bacterium]
MGTGAGLIGPATGPGAGPGWRRLADEVARALPRAELDGLWVFPVIRRDGQEWGTAVLTRVEGDRRRIYTARYRLTLKGRERGQFEWGLEEVGSGPLESLPALLAEVHKRTDDEHPPLPLAVAEWLPGWADGPPG